MKLWNLCSLIFQVHWDRRRCCSSWRLCIKCRKVKVVQHCLQEEKVVSVKILLVFTLFHIFLLLFFFFEKKSKLIYDSYVAASSKVEQKSERAEDDPTIAYLNDEENAGESNENNESVSFGYFFLKENLLFILK